MVPCNWLIFVNIYIDIKYNTIMPKKIQKTNWTKIPEMGTLGVYVLLYLCGKTYIGQKVKAIEVRVKKYEKT